MHKFIDKIKSFEEKPFVINNFVDEDEIKIFQSLYDKLPIEINNTRQKIIKNGLKILLLICKNILKN